MCDVLLNVERFSDRADINNVKRWFSVKEYASWTVAVHAWVGIKWSWHDS
jgi:hypothetical protein